MPDPMTVCYEGPPRAERVEVITSVQRRRRWSTEEKVRIVEETYLPGNSVSLVARHHGIAGNQLFTWRRLMAQGALTAAGAVEQVVPASELRAAHQQIRELQRLLGKKTLENEILREAVERVTAPKKLPLRVTSWPGGRPVSAVAAALGVSRPHLSSRQRTARRRRGRRPLPDAGLLAAIQTLIADLPTYGYRRVHALLRRQRPEREAGLPRHEGAWAPAPAPRRRRGAPARGTHCRGRAQHPLVLGRPGDRLRQRRARARGLRPRLLRPGGHELRGNHQRHHGRGRARPHGGRRRAQVRPGQPLAGRDRVADRQRQLLPRPGDPPLRQGRRAGALHDPAGEPTIERHG